VKKSVIYAATAAGVFWLPFHVPPFRVMPSMSQAFHFNNQAAMAALLCGIAAIALVSRREKGHEARVDAAQAQMGAVPLVIALAVSGVVLVMICLASAWYPFGGGAYFVNRLCEMAAGATPYRDFEFSYGPTMLYFPMLLSKAFGIQLLPAYLATLWIFLWGGLFLLWWIVRQSRGVLQRDQTIAFLLLTVVPALNAEWGLQYMPVRFVCGFAALLVARMAAERLAGRWAPVAACHLGLTAAVFSISTEIGLAFLVALISYWFFEFRSGRRWMALTAAAQIAAMILFVLLAPKELFLSVSVFSAGGSALPLFPSPYILLYAGSLLLVIAPALGRADGVFGTLTPVFAINAIAMMPAALGRSDPGHVLFNGVGVFLLALLAPPIRPHWIYRGIFLLVFPVLALWINPGGNLIWLARVAESARRNAQLIRQNSLDRRWPEIARYGKICVPFGDPDVYYVLSRHNALQPGYYYSITVESPEPEVERQITDVQSCQYAIVPGQILAGAPPVVSVDLTYASRLLMFPLTSTYGTPPVPAPAPAEAFADYVKASFIPLRQVTATQYLCVRKPGS